MLNAYRWEYSPLARAGDYVWKYAVDPVLRFFADDELALLRRTRMVVQVALSVAILLLPASYFFSPVRLITASGLLFDIAGVLRLFLLEEIERNLVGFKPNEYGNLPSVAMRELVMPEASGPYHADSPPMSLFYYKKRGVLFLFIGFVLQMISDLFG
jgi:hypothetical protein